MAGRIVHVRPGAPAEDALAAAVGETQRLDPLAPVTVIVRPGVVSLDLRRRLAARGPYAAVRFVPISRLVELLAAPALDNSGRSRRPLTESVLRASLRRALRSATGPLDRVADHPATEMMLARTYRTLRPLLAEERRALKMRGERARQVVDVIEGARSLLREEFYDSEELNELACSRVEKGEVDDEELGDVVVYLPDPLPRSQVSLLAAASARGLVTVLLGSTGDRVADRASGQVAAALRAAGFEESSPSGPARDGTTPRFDSVIGTPDVEEEVRTALRILMRQLEAGGDIGRSTVVVPAALSSAYLGLVDELFSAADVSWTRARAARLSETPEGRLVCELITLVLGGEGELERSGVIRFLSMPALSPRASLLAPLATVREEAAVPVGAFDRCSRLAGVVSGREEWRHRLGALVRRRGEHPTDTLAAAAADLLDVVEQLLDLRDRLSSATSWDEVASFVRQATESALVESEERDRILDSLAQLSLLEEVEPLRDIGELESRRAQVASSVAVTLEVAAPTRSRFGTGPVVGSLTELAGVRSDLLLVLGANEGVLPSRNADDPLLPEIERSLVPVLSEQERAEERDRRALLTLLAGAERAVALFPRVARGANRLAYPSRWLVGDLFGGVLEEIPSFTAAVGEVAAGRMTAADCSDLEMAMVQAGLSNRLPLSDLVVSEIADLPERLRAESERDMTVTRFGGAVGESARTSDVFESVMSATRLEMLAACPLQFMFAKMLEIEPLESPERRHMLDARERGSLIHAILEQFVVEVSFEKSASSWSETELEVLRSICASRFRSFEAQGKAGKHVYWEIEKRRIVAELEQFILFESRLLDERAARPILTEFPFGFEESEPIVIEAAGKELRFRGRIDRVDEGSDGTISVIDYKTGRTSSSLPRAGNDPLDRGRSLQLPIYARAARDRVPIDRGDGGPRAIVAEYHFTAPDAQPRVHCVELTPEIDARFEEVIAVLADTISGGELPPRPGDGDDWEPENCRRCDYEAICRLDRTRLWERAREAESLASYVALVEGDR